MQLFLKQNMWEKLLAFWKCIVRMVLGQPSKSDTQVWTWDCILSVEKVVTRCHHFQLVWSMWAHPSLKGHLGFEMKKSTKYCYWSHPSCFVSEYLSKGTKRAKMCSAVNVVPCQARLSLVEHAYSCYVHAPTLRFRSDIHNDEYTLTLFIFYVLQYSEHLFRYLVVAHRWFEWIA